MSREPTEAELAMVRGGLWDTAFLARVLEAFPDRSPIVVYAPLRCTECNTPLKDPDDVEEHEGGLYHWSCLQAFYDRMRQAESG